jgi:hypothetical protein
MSGKTNYERQEVSPNKRPLSPIWSGVGCILVAGLMIAGYALTDWFLAENITNRWILIPAEFAWPPIAPYLLVKLAVGAFAVLLGSAVVSIGYALLNPPKPGKYDVRHPEEMTPIYNRRR